MSSLTLTGLTKEAVCADPLGTARDAAGRWNACVALKGAHTFIVQPGEHVKQGQIIGYVGESGIATGSHLDYAVIKNGQQVDPMQYYDESTVTYDPTA